MIEYRVITSRCNNPNITDSEWIHDWRLFDNSDPLKARKEAFRYALSFIEIVVEESEYIELEEIKSKNKLNVALPYSIAIEVFSQAEEQELNERLGLEDVLDELPFTMFGYENLLYDSDVGIEWLASDHEVELYRQHNIPIDSIVSEKEIETIAGEKTSIQYINLQYQFDGLFRLDDNWEVLGHLYDIDLDLVETEPKFVDFDESYKVEFKLRLICGPKRSRKEDYEPLFQILKTINGFLNSKGGKMYIGIANNREIIGIEEDLNHFKGNRDKWKQLIDHKLIEYLGTSIIPKISTKFCKLKGIEVFEITVRRSNSPSFILNERDKNNFCFYVRGQASTRCLNMKAAFEYIIDHWNYHRI